MLIERRMVMRKVQVKERRVERRLAVGGRVRLVPKGRGGPTLTGDLVDVSAGGLRMTAAAHAVLAAGVQVDLAIDLDEGVQPSHAGCLRLVGMGEVVRLQPDERPGLVQTAVRFTRTLAMREPLDAVFLL